MQIIRYMQNNTLSKEVNNSLLVLIVEIQIQKNVNFLEMNFLDLKVVIAGPG